MPGFVDVSNMSDLEIKRLGQQDEDDNDPAVIAHNRRSRRAATPVARYSPDDVWAAACAAFRINGNNYFKEDQYQFGDNAPQRTHRRNRDVMLDLLSNPTQISASDRDSGRQCREFLQKDITFRTLKGNITDFDTAVTRCLALDQVFDSVLHRYEMAVIASLPSSWHRQLARYDLQSRLQSCTPLENKTGDKVDLSVRVLSANYSANYGIYWIKAVTEDQRAVLFSYRTKLSGDAHIRGTVKTQRDGITQLNRVKVIS